MYRLPRVLFAALLLLFLTGCGGSDQPAATSQAADASVEEDPAAQAPEAEVEAPEAADSDNGDSADAVDEQTTTPVDEAEVAADSSDEPEESDAVETVAIVERESVVYDGDFGASIAPIFEAKCAACHNAGGPGAAHWQLEDAADLTDTHEWISSIIQTQTMPPWPASDVSPLFHDDRSLAADEIAAVAAWSAEGAPLDVDAATPIIAAAPLITLDADVDVAPHESYQGSTALSDDYRCLIYDPELTETTWMQGYEFRPDQAEVVHHAVGYLIPGREIEAARELSGSEEGGGWQCYGGSGLNSADLFLGWAPGQQPTIYPEGSGIEMEPGDFMVLQIHYHYDVAAPEDSSTLAIDWAETTEGLDPIQFGEYLGPAEIPCSANETGPLCDRSAAIALARERFGVDGALADVINRRCGVVPEEFAAMTNGTATSACTIPVQTAGKIVSVFGHQHEIGKAVRITLNAGRPDERILLDIPKWSFDWQLNYELVDDVVLRPGDNILLECEWDRSLRAADLEPSYVLWADGTDDEMCFATITTRLTDSAVEIEDEREDPSLSDDLLACAEEKGISEMPFPPRDEIDAATAILFECEFADVLGAAYTKLIASDFVDLMSETDFTCIQNYLSGPDGLQAVMLSSQSDSSDAERLPVAEVIADCISFADALTNLGLPIPESGRECADAAGRDIIIEAIMTGVEPDQSAVLGILGPCLAGG